jgi:hypothetical protein
MMRLTTLGVLGLFILVAPSQSRIINIPSDHATIQAGIDASFDGDTVLVAPGIYTENIANNGHDIVLASRFLLTSDTSFISITIIDGNHSGSVVTISGRVRPPATLAGFTIRNGSAEAGSGINCIDSSPIIKDNIITNNLAPLPFGVGGGINAFWHPGPLIINNIISYNRANEGGGIFVQSSNAIIRGNIITYNHAYFSQDMAGGIGGGIYFTGSPSILSNNIICNNTAPHGAGISCFNGVLDTIVNSIIWGNRPSQILSDPANTIYYSSIEDGYPGMGNINSNPLFRDTLSGDFHLMSIACGDSADSPCIDAGNPDSLDTELNCSAGLGTSRSDMGAYGGATNITGLENDGFPETPAYLLILECYPNPFNSSATLSLNKIIDAEIAIFDITGRRVATLHAENGRAIWDSGGHSSGVYFASILGEPQGTVTAHSTRMILLK